MSYYAVMQLGYVIYGVGETPDQAIEDAMEWADDIDITPFHEAAHGDMVVVEITAALYNAVNEIGGDICFERVSHPMFGSVEYGTCEEAERIDNE